LPTRRGSRASWFELKDDVEVTEKLDELVLNPLDGPKLVAFLKGMEFTSLTRRVAEATETDASAVDAAESGRGRRG
jgi:DNA polymerase-1